MQGTCGIVKFVFGAADTNVTITGFDSNTDKVNLDALTTDTATTAVAGNLTTTAGKVYFLGVNDATGADSEVNSAMALSNAAVWSAVGGTDPVTAYVVVVDTDSSAIYKFVDTNNNGVDAGELFLMGTVNAKLTTADLIFA